MKIQQRFVTAVLTFLIISSLTIPIVFGSPRKSRNRSNKQFTIVVDRTELQLTAEGSAYVTARVLDGNGNEVREARIAWNVDKVLQNSVILETVNHNRANIRITGKTKIPNLAGMFYARWGNALAGVFVQVQNQRPSQILFPKGKKVVLPINGRETISASVHDEQGNRIGNAEISWAPADPDHSAFIFVGQNINKDGVNSVDVSWLPGKPELKTPSEIKLVARAGDATEIVIIDYKPAKLEKVVVTLEPKQISIGPGQSATVEVTALGEDKRVLKIEESEASIGDEIARKYMTAFADKKTITVIGMYGDPKSPPDTLVRSVLVVKVAGGLATIPVIYQRDPAVVDWDIVPPNIVGDNYGRTIKNDFYCIEVTIQNNSGSDLALAGLRFYNGEFYRPTAGYGIVRGSLAKRKLTHPRSMTLAIVDSVGSLMTGFNPFFHNVNHGKNFSNIIDIVSNPLAKGLEKTWKDPYPDEVARFEQDVLRDDKIIPNGGVFKTRIFVPKRSVFPSKEQVQYKNDLAKVRKELGSLWVLGYKFEKGAIHNIGMSK